MNENITKKIACDFFQYWHNNSGIKVENEYDNWWRRNKATYQAQDQKKHDEIKIEKSI